MSGFPVMSLISLPIILGFWGISIYCLILFIRLGHKGLKALDIYIEKNKTMQ